MARIAYAEIGTADADVASVLTGILESLDSRSGAAMKDAEVPYIFRALANSPRMLEAMWNLLGAVWNGTELDREIQELVILRVAQVRRSDYEWGRHRRVAELVGVADAKVDALARFKDAPELSAAERAAVALADVLAREGDAPQETVDAVREHFTERQLMELTLLAAMYVMVAIFLKTLQIDQEPGDPRVPPAEV
jgi:4-carboxymuconolactone decarboxylase